MATLATLEEMEFLRRLELALPPGALPLRLVYVTPEFARWIEEELSAVESGWIGEKVSPLEQLYELMVCFVTGAPLAVGRQFRRLRPLSEPHGVWELKTADLRIFGWFHRRDLFIAARGSTAEKVKRHNLYAGFRDEVRRVRESLALDPADTGREMKPDEVVSSAY